MILNLLWELDPHNSSIFMYGEFYNRMDNGDINFFSRTKASIWRVVLVFLVFLGWIESRRLIGLGLLWITFIIIIILKKQSLIKYIVGVWLRVIRRLLFKLFYWRHKLNLILRHIFNTKYRYILFVEFFIFNIKKKYHSFSFQLCNCILCT